MAITFSTIDKDGRTVADDPKRSAYAYMFRLGGQSRTYTLTVEDGEYKVESPGLMTLIFVKETKDDRTKKESEA